MENQVTRITLNEFKAAEESQFSNLKTGNYSSGCDCPDDRPQCFHLGIKVTTDSKPERAKFNTSEELNDWFEGKIPTPINWEAEAEALGDVSDEEFEKNVRYSNYGVKLTKDEIMQLANIALKDDGLNLLLRRKLLGGASYAEELSPLERLKSIFDSI